MLPDDDKRYAIGTCRSSESVLKKWFKINDIQLVHLLVMWYLVKNKQLLATSKLDKLDTVHKGKFKWTQYIKVSSNGHSTPAENTFNLHFRLVLLGLCCLPFADAIRLKNSREIRCVSISKTNQMKQDSEIIAFYCETHTKCVNTLCGHKQTFR